VKENQVNTPSNKSIGKRRKRRAKNAPKILE
jgi:hypothetical protein